MTDLAEPAAAAAHPDLTHVSDVAERFVELMRAFNRARTRMMQATDHEVEWASHIILRCLQNEGSMRAGGIADCLQTDPSTVSRQVATLVKDGYLERRADPGDGRASLLVLTARAEALLADHDRIRIEYFGYILRDWSADDVRDFAGMLDRFTVAYEAADDHWIKNRLATRAERAGSTN